MSSVKNGDRINVHYVGSFEDGTKFDSSRDRGETLSFEVGSGQVIKGFDEGVVGMTPGDSKVVKIEAQDGYGDHNSDLIREVPRSSFQGDLELKEGVTMVGKNELGQQVVGLIKKIHEEIVVVDFNHPLAGKNLNFEIELVSID